ncbi:MAG: hypothetical protein MHM6MM_005196 [Cercozoa sp. M6MM]
MSLLDQKHNIRAVLDTVDRLRDHIAASGDTSIRLPSIAVVGDQSSGKSSVLEALSGVALPRGTGIVTRCPLVLRMVCVPAGQEEYAMLRAAPPAIGPPDAACNEKKVRLEEIDTAIAELTKTVAGNDRGISSRELKLVLYRQDVPDLTLVDLPGITRNPVGDQPVEIYEQVTALIEKYIAPSSTIVLNVMPADVDMSTSESLRMSRRVDRSGQRTVAVLTKSDRIEKTLAGDLDAMLAGHQGKGGVLGYVAVRCRTQTEIDRKVPMQEVRRLEAQLFASHPALRQLPAESKGVEALARLLASLQLRRVQATMPTLAHRIEEALDEATEQAAAFGRVYATESACRSALAGMLLKADAELRRRSLSMQRLGAPLNALLRRFDRNSRGITDTAEEASVGSDDEDAEIALYAKDDDESKRVAHKMALRYPENEATHKYMRRHINGTQRGGRVDLGADAVLESSLHRLVQTLLPALERLHADARVVAESAITDVIDRSFSREQFPRLHKKVRKVALQTVAELHTMCREQTELCINMARDDVFTLDPRYDTVFVTAQSAIASNESKVTSMRVDGRVVDMRVVSREFKKSPVVTSLQCKLVAYWAVARPRLVDEVARYMRHFLHVLLLRQLTLRLHQSFPDDGSTKLLPYFQQTPEIEARRRRVTARVDALRDAVTELQKLRDSPLFDFSGRDDEQENDLGARGVANSNFGAAALSWTKWAAQSTVRLFNNANTDGADAGNTDGHGHGDASHDSHDSSSTESMTSTGN